MFGKKKKNKKKGKAKNQEAKPYRRVYYEEDLVNQITEAITSHRNKNDYSQEKTISYRRTQPEDIPNIAIEIFGSAIWQVSDK